MCTGRLASRRSGPAGRRLGNRAGGIRGSESSHLSLKIYVTAATGFHENRRTRGSPDAGRRERTVWQDPRPRTGCPYLCSIGDERYRRDILPGWTARARGSPCQGGGECSEPRAAIQIDGQASPQLTYPEESTVRLEEILRVFARLGRRRDLPG
ncbi:hypothetical protein KM043_009608 [Ampulex compressa]|nr:hypothetical protein KM043_009608 [Ampulex compressa]